MKARHHVNIRRWLRESAPEILLGVWLLAVPGCVQNIPPATPAEQAEMMIHQGLADYHAGDLAGASQKFSRAFQISASVDDRPGIADAKNGLCAVQLQQGRYPAALKECREAFDIYSALQHTQGVVASLLNIGLIHLQLRDYRAAGKDFAEALDTAQANQLTSLDRLEQAP
jgi:tetratricopeptide (TPR) repeat protein